MSVREREDGSIWCGGEEDLEKVVKEMGWDGLESFLDEVGVGLDEVLGVWFTIVDGRVFVD